MRLRPVSMDFNYGSSFGERSPSAYETLLVDAMVGDATLYTRQDMVEASWQAVEPILDNWTERRSIFRIMNPAPGVRRKPTRCSRELDTSGGIAESDAHRLRFEPEQILQRSAAICGRSWRSRSGRFGRRPARLRHDPGGDGRERRRCRGGAPHARRADARSSGRAVILRLRTKPGSRRPGFRRMLDAVRQASSRFARRVSRSRPGDATWRGRAVSGAADGPRSSGGAVVPRRSRVFQRMRSWTSVAAGRQDHLRSSPWRRSRRPRWRSCAVARAGRRVADLHWTGSPVWREMMATCSTTGTLRPGRQIGAGVLMAATRLATCALYFAGWIAGGAAGGTRRLIAAERGRRAWTSIP